VARRDPERVARISDEVAYGFGAMADVAQAVSIFGSARTPADHPHYILARTVAAHLGACGFDIITGGGPGVMEARPRSARSGSISSCPMSRSSTRSWIGRCGSGTSSSAN
jgi:hypothetical protein